MNAYLLSELASELNSSHAWEITETRTEGWEFYFIRHRLDQHRAKEVTHTTLKVYRRSEDGQFLGSASCEIQEAAGQEDVRAAVRMLSEQAALVRNPVYQLREPRPVTASAAEDLEIQAMAGAFIRAMQNLPEDESADINSYEIFVRIHTRHFMNSNGIDLTETVPDSMIEVVVNARENGHEIELYRNYTSGTCDPETLQQELTDTLRCGRDRLHTVPTPPLGRTDLVLSTSAAVDVYDYFISRMSAGMKYQRISDWEIGQTVTESPLTITALRTLPNSSGNHAFDAEGAPIRDLTILDHGRAAAYYGSKQFSDYLGLTDTFSPQNFRADGGEASEESLRAGNCLEVVEFSDFQVDPMTGDIAGEIRLGYLHSDDKITIVSGGSVSGNMRESKLSFSAALKQYDTCLIPAVTRLSDIHVTGIES